VDVIARAAQVIAIVGQRLDGDLRRAGTNPTADALMESDELDADEIDLILQVLGSC
jgi:hypothetical protein